MSDPYITGLRVVLGMSIGFGMGVVTAGTMGVHL